MTRFCKLLLLFCCGCLSASAQTVKMQDMLLVNGGKRLSIMQHDTIPVAFFVSDTTTIEVLYDNGRKLTCRNLQMLIMAASGDAQLIASTKSRELRTMCKSGCRVVTVSAKNLSSAAFYIRGD
jgi:hypothetical protein